MKRSLAIVITSVAMLIAGTAAAEPSGDPFENKLRPISPDQTMSAEEVTRYALPYLPRVARCYRTHALPARRATGELSLYLVIARDGRVVHTEITAPGVPLFRALRLERCLRTEIRTWHFPPRTGFTNAVVPYFFLHTRAPASGPYVPDRAPPRMPPPDRTPPRRI